MRLLTIICVVLLALVPVAGRTQHSAAHLLAKADTLMNHFGFDEAQGITDSLLTTKLGAADSAKALLMRGRILVRSANLDEATTSVLQALEMAEKLDLPDVQASAHITLGLIYEWIEDWPQSMHHLDQAQQLLFQHKLEWRYSEYYVRRSSLAIMGHLSDSIGDPVAFGEQAQHYATLYQQPWHLTDAHMLQAAALRGDNSGRGIYHAKLAARVYLQAGQYDLAAHRYLRIATQYGRQDSLELAWLYYDSAETTKLLTGPIGEKFYGAKGDLLMASEQYDSAYAVANQRLEVFARNLREDQRIEVSRVAAVQENQQKQVKLNAQIRENEEQQTLLQRTVILLMVVFGLALLVFFSYRKQRAQTQKIEKQRELLENSLHQQRILLAEVQHRVKNNLQVIIAMLDMQREAPEGKTIDEITTENQRRIESMAFLHDKVYLSEDLENVKLQSYLEELAELMRETYSGKGVEIDIQIQSEVATVPVGKAIPLGLATVELLMNSFKHAFKNRDKGSIAITTNSIEHSKYSAQFIYQDNGHGFTGQPRKGGLGLEIINGFVGQLSGHVTMDGSEGYKATIRF